LFHNLPLPNVSLPTGSLQNASGLDKRRSIWYIRFNGREVYCLLSGGWEFRLTFEEHT
jgi:hypothetical protein